MDKFVLRLVRGIAVVISVYWVHKDVSDILEFQNNVLERL